MKTGWSILGLALLACCAFQVLASPQRLSVRWEGRSVRVGWGDRNPDCLVRSTHPWPGSLEAAAKLPQTSFNVRGRDEFCDLAVAPGVTYFYSLRSGQGPWMATAQVAIPPQPLASSSHPRLVVDKRNYCLEVWHGKTMLKRYPVAMGKAPMVRKLRQDNASTPEGRYRIVGTQPQATFYRAYDIDYPNGADRARHQLLKPDGPIGGEIQIHGCGIGSNWTFGCVALRNEDMDELFSHREIGVGTEVWIYGAEVAKADLQSDVANPYTAIELGRLQRARGLKVTCLWDVASSAAMRPGSRP